MDNCNCCGGEVNCGDIEVSPDSFIRRVYEIEIIIGEARLYRTVCNKCIERIYGDVEIKITGTEESWDCKDGDPWDVINETEKNLPTVILSYIQKESKII